MRSIIFLKKGFTLIELLVVIAIIAVITSIGVANLITAQKQARDSSRREILGNVQSAFEQYYAANAYYPSTTAMINSSFDNGIAPTDPKNSASGGYVITWKTAATQYCVCAKLESGVGNGNIPTTTQCDWNTTGTYYCVQNKQ